MIFYRTLEDRNFKGLPGVFDHPGAQLEAGGLKAGPLEEGDESSMSTTHFQDLPGREPVAEKRVQPADTAARQIALGSLQNIRVIEIFFLMCKPIAFAVIIGVIVVHPLES